MILIGQFDSPFTRRVGITLKTYGLAFEHRPWSVFSDADKLAGVNPLIRVPTLVLDSGEPLPETSSIIDYLDGLVDEGVRLYPQAQPARYLAMRVVSVASGISDKAVTLFYEQRLHESPSPQYMKRIIRQIEGALIWLETDRTSKTGPFWQDGRMTQADIAVTCMFRHLSEAHPSITPQGRYPALERHCADFEAQDVFRQVSQAFVAPA